MTKRNTEFQIFVKPAGASCNLACSYCYYLEKEELYPGSAGGSMSYEILEKYIVQHISASNDNEIFFSWHGGEPLLAGISFFEKVVEIQQRHKPEGYVIKNGIQTNGTLLNDNWCRFIRENDFFTGLSIDGDQEFHDMFRVYAGGRPSFNKAIGGYELLKKYNCRSEILCVVNSINVKHPLRVYRFLKGLDVSYITFLPLVRRSKNSPVAVTGDTVLPEDFGNFLCSVFDEWQAEDIGRIKIQIIEEAVRTAFEMEHTLCIFREKCGGVPVIEQNGDFYSCDHFVDREHLIGNIGDTPLEMLLDDERQINFGKAKEDTLPGYCKACEVLSMCNGECPRNRFAYTASGEPGLNYLCPGYRMFFNHMLPFINAVRNEWKQSGT